MEYGEKREAMDGVWGDKTSYGLSVGRQNKLWMVCGETKQAMDGVWGDKTSYG